MAVIYRQIHVDEKYKATLEPNLYHKSPFADGKTFTSKYEEGAAGGIFVRKLVTTAVDVVTPGRDFQDEAVSDELIPVVFNNNYQKSKKIYGLIKGEHILHTAHRTPTSSSAFSRLYDILAKAEYKEKEDFIVTRQYGLEKIEMIEGGGLASFRTRTSKGGLGEGYDLLIIDEAQEYQNDQETTLKYVVSSSPNSQMIFCGTPPTMVSSGTVFTHMRENILAGKTSNTGWAEWSVESMTDVNDIEAWYETNPSLGTILTERKIRDEMFQDGWFTFFNHHMYKALK